MTRVQTCALPICESIALIRAAGAIPYAVAIALDRQEMATEGGQDLPYSAVQYMRRELGLQLCCIAKLDDLMDFLQAQNKAGDLSEHLQRVGAYRERYGVRD